MIKLTKAEAPDVLVRNAAEWRQELLAHIHEGTDPSEYLLRRYAHPQIKDALLHETRGKCAYCESKFRHVAYGDIEHIVPKNVAPDRKFDWDNLTVACDVCNTNKGSVPGLLDPYTQDPSEVFYYLGPLVFSIPNHEAGLLTELKLKLNRTALVERRVERINGLQSIARSIKLTTGEAKNALIDLLRSEADIEREYSACAVTAVDQILAAIEPS